MGGGTETAEIARADLQLLHTAAGMAWNTAARQTSASRLLGSSTSSTLLRAPGLHSVASSRGAVEPMTVAVAVGESDHRVEAQSLCNDAPAPTLPTSGRLWIVLMPSLENQLKYRQVQTA